MNTKIFTSVLLLLSGFLAHAQSPAWQWAKCAGSAGTNYAYGLCTDPGGNVYMAGGFSGASINLGGNTLTNVSSSEQEFFIAKYDPSGNVIWAQSAAGYNSGRFNGNIATNPGGISSDRFGNVYAVGSFEGSMIVFGGDTLFNPDPLQSDVFLVKYDSSGNVIWAQTSISNAASGALAVSTDAAGNAYITGYFVSSIQFGTTVLGTLGSTAFIVKYDASGNVVWATCPLHGTSCQGEAIASDSIGNVCVTGYFQDDSLTFGPFTVYNPSPYGSLCTFTVKYDTGGNVIWAEAPWGGNSTSNRGAGIAVDQMGNTYITGSYQQSNYIIFGNDTLTNTSNPQDDIFIVKYDPSGNVSWGLDATTPDGADIRGIAAATDLHGDLYILGSAMQTNGFVLGNDSLDFGPSPHLGSFFTLKFDTAGGLIWANTAGAGGQVFGGSRAAAFAADTTGAVYVAGSLESSTAVFGNLSITSPSGEVFFFIAKLDTPSGSVNGLRTIDNTAGQTTVFPNPSSGVFTIITSLEDCRLTVTDATGRQIMTEDITTGASQIDMNNSESGIYFLRVTSDSGSAVFKVLLVR